jgi:hypothetical protein
VSHRIKATNTVNPLSEIARAFGRERRVAFGGGKGFGSRALKVDGKIFAL